LTLGSQIQNYTRADKFPWPCSWGVWGRLQGGSPKAGGQSHTNQTIPRHLHTGFKYSVCLHKRPAVTDLHVHTLCNVQESVHFLFNYQTPVPFQLAWWRAICTTLKDSQLLFIFSRLNKEVIQRSHSTVRKSCFIFRFMVWARTVK
jgi:hypothetical protein